MWSSASDFLSSKSERYTAARAQYLREYGSDLPESPGDEPAGTSLISSATEDKEERLEFDAPVHTDNKVKELEFEFLNDDSMQPLSCSGAQDAHNRAQIRKMRTVDVPKLNRLFDWGRSRGGDSSDTTEMVRLVDGYNSTKGFSFYRCLPSFNEFVAAYNGEFVPAFNNAISQQSRGTGVVWDNANRELGGLRTALTSVSDVRRTFETTSNGGAGVSGINTAHDRFLAQSRKVRTFTLTRFDFGNGRIEDPAKFAAEATGLEQSEARVSTITELDRVRDEYVTKSRPVPLPSELTQSKSSTHFSFNELNSGSYTWAVLTDALFTQLEAARTALGNMPISILIPTCID